MTGSDDAVWSHAPDLAVVDSPERVVLLNLRRPAEPARILLGTAAEIWRTIDGERAQREVVERMASSYGVGPAEVLSDVVSFCVDLEHDGLLINRSLDARGTAEVGPSPGPGARHG